uniref:Uncharacterized protein n=1 Tax=Anguilla anguilla TaxID=7936 RepID=A0A0E9T3F2_ANGAN
MHFGFLNASTKLTSQIPQAQQPFVQIYPGLCYRCILCQPLKECCWLVHGIPRAVN